VLTVSMLELLEVGVSVQLASSGLNVDNDPAALQQVTGICCWNTCVTPADTLTTVRFHAAASKKSV